MVYACPRQGASTPIHGPIARPSQHRRDDAATANARNGWKRSLQKWAGERIGIFGWVGQPVFEALAVTPPRLPSAFGCGHDDFARIGGRSFNLVPTQAALTAEHNLDHGRILSDNAKEGT